jgi:hypothetical protein
MKISIKTNKTNLEDLGLYFTHHCIDLIKKDLLAKLGSYQEVYNYLLNKYNEIRNNKGQDDYRSYSLKDDNYEDKIFSLICGCERENTYIFYATIIKLSEKYNLEYLKLFVLIDHKLNFSKENEFKTKLLFPKESALEIVNLLKEAQKSELLKNSKSIHHALFDVLNKKNTKVTDTVTTGISGIYKEVENIEYIMFEDCDEYLNDSDTYNRNLKFDYKSIILSEDFQNYLKEDKNFNEYGRVEDFSDYVNEYLEEDGLDFSEELNQYILKTKPENTFVEIDTVKNLSVEEESLI